MGRAAEIWTSVNAFLVDNFVGVIIVGLAVALLVRPIERAIDRFFGPETRLLKDIRLVEATLHEFETGKFIASCTALVLGLMINFGSMFLAIALWLVMDTRPMASFASSVLTALQALIVGMISYSIVRMGWTLPRAIFFLTTIQSPAARIADLKKRVVRLPRESRLPLTVRIGNIEAHARALNLLVQEPSAKLSEEGVKALLAEQ